MGINRIRLANGMTNPNQGLADPNLTARQVAEQNPELHAMRQNFFGTDYLSDIDQGNTGTVQYYTGLGNPTSLEYTPPVVETPAVDTSTPVVDGGGGGTLPPINLNEFEPQNQNTPEQQRLIDEGIGLQIEPGSPVFAPGEEPVTQGDIDAFNQIPVNREYGDEMNIGYGEGQVDPSLAAAVGGVDTTPIDLTGNIQVEDSSKPFDDQIGITGQKVSYPGDQSGTISGVTNIEDLPQVRTITDGQDNIYDAATSELLGNKYEYQGQFEPDEGTVFDDSSELGYQINQKFNSIKDAGAAGVDKLKDSLTALGGKVKEGFDNVIEIGGQAIDLGKSLASGVLSLATGIPGAGLLLNNLPERDARQNALDDLYDVKDGTIQSGLMEGYNPVSGNPLDPTFGLQEAYQKRIDTIEKTLAEKYPDGDYSGTELDERLADLKLAKTEEQDVLGITEGVRSGIQAADDDSESEMLDLPTDNNIIETNINNNILADDKINNLDTSEVDIPENYFDTVTDDYDFSDFDDGDTSVAADTPAGSNPINSFFDTVDNSAQEAAAAQAAADAQAAANQDSYRGGGGGDPAPTGVDAGTADVQDYFDDYSYEPPSQSSSNGGNGNTGGGGGTHCCTAANERGDMTLLEVKKLRVWHRKQSKIWQKGYDVWGRVMADNLVSKYKWSSDRVRDFYNHKIYGKRTIGSTFADLCIYPMSMVIGCILTVMPPILGYQKQENKND